MSRGKLNVLQVPPEFFDEPKADQPADAQVSWNEDELAGVGRCVCGKYWIYGECPTIGTDEKDPTTMPCCGRRLYFRATLVVYEVKA